MENEDVILEQMEDTRTSLTEKLESLEKQVASTVQGATSNVAETVEAVKETVEAVKDTVQDTVATVKDSVEDTISTVKESVNEGLTAVKGMFDIPGLVDSHPWAMMGGAVALGFVLETLVVGPPPQRDRFVGAEPKPFPPDHYSGEDRLDSRRPARSAFSGMFKTFEPEINRLKSLALGALMNSIRDMAVKAAPEHLAPKLTEVFNSITQKLGGELLDAESARASAAGERFGNSEHVGNGRKQEKASTEG